MCGNPDYYDAIVQSDHDSSQNLMAVNYYDALVQSDHDRSLNSNGCELIWYYSSVWSW